MYVHIIGERNMERKRKMNKEKRERKRKREGKKDKLFIAYNGIGSKSAG